MQDTSSRFRPYEEAGKPLVERYEDFSSTLTTRNSDGHSRFEPAPGAALLDRYYNGAFSGGGNETYNLDAQFRPEVVEVARGVRRLVQEFAGFPDAFTFHDFGCAFGALVWGFQQLGVTATGNEPNVAWVTAGNERCHGALTAAPLAEHLSSLGYELDLLTALHVIEHLADPGAALRSIREHLAPEGLVYICVPNAASIQYVLGGRRADAGYVYPMHLNYFTPKSICIHLREAGLEPFLLETRWLPDSLKGPDFVYDALANGPRTDEAGQVFEPWISGMLFGQEIFVLAGLPGNRSCRRDSALDLKVAWTHRLANPALHGPRIPAPVAAPSSPTPLRDRLPPKLRYALGRFRQGLRPHTS